MSSRAHQDNGPVRALREAWGLSLSDFSKALGLSYHTVWSAEAGVLGTIPKRMLKAVTDAGGDAEGLEREYVAWVAARARDMRQKIAAQAEATV